MLSVNDRGGTGYGLTTKKPTTSAPVAAANSMTCSRASRPLQNHRISPMCISVTAFVLDSNTKGRVTMSRADYWASGAPFSEIDADGLDGSLNAYQRGSVRCLVDKSWNGGDDADGTYTPLPCYREVPSCRPRHER